MEAGPQQWVPIINKVEATLLVLIVDDLKLS